LTCQFGSDNIITESEGTMKVYEVTVSWEVVSTIKVKASSEEDALNTAQFHCPITKGVAPYWSKPENVSGSEVYWSDIKVVDDSPGYWSNHQVKSKKAKEADIKSLKVGKSD